MADKPQIAPVNICVGDETSSFATTISSDVQAYVTQSLSPATKRAYKADMAHYETSGGIIPSNDQMIANYIARLAETHAVSTISRRIAAIGKAHRSKGLADPTKSELVRATMRGIRRAKGVAQNEAKPMLKEDLMHILDHMHRDDGTDTKLNMPKLLRDTALLLIGFAGGFRRSELVGLNIEDINQVRQGMIVTITRSKTDQTGVGRKVGIPHARGNHCPVMALGGWLDVVLIEAGPIFRPINRHGQTSSKRLSGEAVSEIIQVKAEQAGLDPNGYSGHSLRAGLATSAAMAGIATHKIRQQTGHKSDTMLARYIRDGDLFRDNAAGML